MNVKLIYISVSPNVSIFHSRCLDIFIAVHVRLLEIQTNRQQNQTFSVKLTSAFEMVCKDES